ncbi:MAG TPA: hypothetical protein PLR18_02930 [bacterium]|nr:hypothetical protein [bacterium]
MKERKIVVHDQMQSGYTYYLTAPTGRSFAPDFHPDLTPRQMLVLGVFGGRYLRDCQKEFPRAWFAKAKLLPIGRAGHDRHLNYFGVDASQPLSVWRAKGWLHPDDPRGWFQWYCRYYLGRRHEDDTRQIKRWRLMTRHIMQIKKHCRPGDIACHARQRQALLHWAYDSRQY